MRTRAAGVGAVLLAACAAGTGGGSHGAQSPPPPPAQGVLVTWAGGTPVGRERFRDDGRVLTSDVALGAGAITVSVSRAPREVRFRAGGAEVVRAVPNDTAVLENGSWQAYALAAEWFADAREPTPVTVFVPSRDARVPGTIVVAPAADGGRVVTVTLGAVTVTARVSPAGIVTHAEVPAQSVEALPEGESPASLRRSPPQGVEETPWEIDRGGVAVRGVLWRPAGVAGRVPVVVLVAGSGPTDRDGNNRLGAHGDTYRLLAEALAAHGVATVRFDKRGVGASGTNFDPARITLRDLVDDAAAFVERARADATLGPVTLAGHSEGALIALEIADREPVDALVLLAAPGRPLGAVVREQLARQLDEPAMREFDRVLAAVRAGADPEPVPSDLRQLFAVPVRAYIRSEIDVDPLALLHALREPAPAVSVVQGEFDAQVPVSDARALAAARPGVRLTVLPRANHLFKEESSASLPQPSYADPSRPLAAGFVDAVLAGVAGPAR